MKRIAIVLVDRANYGRLKPVMTALRARAEVELLTICAGTMLLERFAIRGQSKILDTGFNTGSVKDS